MEHLGFPTETVVIFAVTVILSLFLTCSRTNAMPT